MLTPLQQKQFIDDGYLVIKNFLNFDAVSAIKHHMQEKVIPDLEGKWIEGGRKSSLFSSYDNSKIDKEIFLRSAHGIEPFFEEEALNITSGELKLPFSQALNKIGHALHAKDPVFRELSEHSQLIEIMADLGYEKAKSVQSMYVFKRPGIGGEVTWHQDQTFIRTDSKPVLGFWLAIDEASVENGCLWAIPGYHKERRLKKRFIRESDDTLRMEEFDIVPWDEERALPLKASPGTLIVLDGHCPHRSSANLSDKPREAYTLHTVDARAHYGHQNWIRLSD